jgi:hypothetical protein
MTQLPDFLCQIFFHCYSCGLVGLVFGITAASNWPIVHPTKSRQWICSSGGMVIDKGNPKCPWINEHKAHCITYPTDTALGLNSGSGDQISRSGSVGTVAYALMAYGDSLICVTAIFRSVTLYIIIIAIIIICLLNPWSRVLLQRLTGSQLVKKLLAFYGNRRLISAFTSARHLSLSWARSIHSMPPIPLPEDPF